MFCKYISLLFLFLLDYQLCIQPFQAALHLTLPWENRLPNNNLKTLISTSIYSAFFKPFDQKGVSPAAKSYSQTEATEPCLCFLNEVWLTLIFCLFPGPFLVHRHPTNHWHTVTSYYHSHLLLPVPRSASLFPWLDSQPDNISSSLFCLTQFPFVSFYVPSLHDHHYSEC